MLDTSKLKIVKRGKCLYDNTAEYEVIIIESDVLHGSGDHEDPPEITNDKEIKCYYCCLDHPNNRDVFNVGRSGFLSIEEAVKDIERFTDVRWLD